MAEVLFYLLSIACGYELPLLAIQLLWINIVTDGIQDVALSFEKSSRDIMKEKPRSTKESLFNGSLSREVSVFGVTIGLMIFGIWSYLVDSNVDLLIARSITMLLMVFIQNIHVLNCRSESESIFKLSLLSNPLAIFTIIISIVLQLIVTEVPFLSNLLGIVCLDFSVIIKVFAFSLIIILVSEVYKYIYRKREK